MTGREFKETEPPLPLVAPAKAGAQGRATTRFPLGSRFCGNDGSEIAALRITATGGREATTRHILPKTALAAESAAVLGKIRAML